ncbi:hypothetical protein DFJ73DRAFT_962085 [Zopfochytrium polystomum]|nr:hypothetical protein DFJ73DRAFT_962085 [Zopfochytrium polystomum]
MADASSIGNNGGGETGLMGLASASSPLGGGLPGSESGAVGGGGGGGSTTTTISDGIGSATSGSAVGAGVVLSAMGPSASAASTNSSSSAYTTASTTSTSASTASSASASLVLSAFPTLIEEDLADHRSRSLSILTAVARCRSAFSTVASALLDLADAITRTDDSRVSRSLRPLFGSKDLDGAGDMEIEGILKQAVAAKVSMSKAFKKLSSEIAAEFEEPLAQLLKNHDRSTSLKAMDSRSGILRVEMELRSVLPNQREQHSQLTEELSRLKQNHNRTVLSDESKTISNIRRFLASLLSLEYSRFKECASLAGEASAAIDASPGPVTIPVSEFNSEFSDPPSSLHEVEPPKASPSQRSDLAKSEFADSSSSSNLANDIQQSATGSMSTEKDSMPLKASKNIDRLVTPRTNSLVPFQVSAGVRAKLINGEILPAGPEKFRHLTVERSRSDARNYNSPNSNGGSGLLPPNARGKPGRSNLRPVSEVSITSRRSSLDSLVDAARAALTFSGTAGPADSSVDFERPRSALGDDKGYSSLDRKKSKAGMANGMDYDSANSAAFSQNVVISARKSSLAIAEFPAPGTLQRNGQSMATGSPPSMPQQSRVYNNSGGVNLNYSAQQPQQQPGRMLNISTNENNFWIPESNSPSGGNSPTSPTATAGPNFNAKGLQNFAIRLFTNKKNKEALGTNSNSSNSSSFGGTGLNYSGVVGQGNANSTSNPSASFAGRKDPGQYHNISNLNMDFGPSVMTPGDQPSSKAVKSTMIQSASLQTVPTPATPVMMKAPFFPQQSNQNNQQSQFPQQSQQSKPGSILPPSANTLPIPISTGPNVATAVNTLANSNPTASNPSALLSKSNAGAEFGVPQNHSPSTSNGPPTYGTSSFSRNQSAAPPVANTVGPTTSSPSASLSKPPISARRAQLLIPGPERKKPSILPLRPEAAMPDLPPLDTAAPPAPLVITRNIRFNDVVEAWSPDSIASSVLSSAAIDGNGVLPVAGGTRVRSYMASEDGSGDTGGAVSVSSDGGSGTVDTPSAAAYPAFEGTVVAGPVDDVVKGDHVVALHAFAARSGKEMSLAKGDVVAVHKKSGTWIYGTKLVPRWKAGNGSDEDKGEMGWIPVAFVARFLLGA